MPERKKYISKAEFYHQGSDEPAKREKPFMDNFDIRENLSFYLIISVFIIVVAGLGMIPIIVYGIDSQGFRWLLFVSVLILANAIIFLHEGPRLSKPSSWEGRMAGKKNLEGEVKRLDDAIKRARSGYAYSQLMVKQRLIKILAERIRGKHQLSIAQINEIFKDPHKLAKYIGDKELALYISGSVDERPPTVNGRALEWKSGGPRRGRRAGGAPRGGSSFEGQMYKIIEKIEEFR